MNPNIVRWALMDAKTEGEIDIIKFTYFRFM
jgi:hypothetical protein